MKSIHAALLSAAAAVALFAGPAPEAKAGDVSNAKLQCLVDTYAFDPLTDAFCYSTWAPGLADNPTVAYFAVAGLTPGNYSYHWTDLETGGTPCGNESYCIVSIETETRGDGYAALSVKITDTQTGAHKTVTAQAMYFDGYN